MTGATDDTDPYSELSGIVLSDESLDTILERVATLAKKLVPRVSEVSVTLVQGEAASTAAYTGALANDLDKTQYTYGDGPCLTAARTHEPVRIADMATDGRWPEFAMAAKERGVRSVLSIGLPLQEGVVGALNMYSLEDGAFDDRSLELAESFAGHATVALANATLYASATKLAEQMSEAMRSRAVIEQAKGILMAQRHCTADEAFEILTLASQRANKKVRDIAAAIVETTAREK